MTSFRDSLPASQAAVFGKAVAEYGPIAVDAAWDLAALRAELGAEAFARQMWPQVKNHTRYRTREEWSAAYEARLERKQRKAAA